MQPHHSSPNTIITSINPRVSRLIQITNLPLTFGKLYPITTRHLIIPWAREYFSLVRSTVVLEVRFYTTISGVLRRRYQNRQIHNQIAPSFSFSFLIKTSFYLWVSLSLSSPIHTNIYSWCLFRERHKPIHKSVFCAVDSYSSMSSSLFIFMQLVFILLFWNSEASNGSLSYGRRSILREITNDGKNAEKSDYAVELNATNFDSVLKDTPATYAVVEFFAHW